MGWGIEGAREATNAVKGHYKVVRVELHSQKSIGEHGGCCHR